jgi:hypothetical protein
LEKEGTGQWGFVFSFFVQRLGKPQTWVPIFRDSSPKTRLNVPGLEREGKEIPPQILPGIKNGLHGSGAPKDTVEAS